jgi:protein-L-isoaspartate(D-aspartate) O-methyltransferase
MNYSYNDGDTRLDFFTQKRKEMIENQISARGVTDEKVLKAFSEVPREKFVSEDYQELSYNDHPLPIGHGVTISQPYIVALMCQILQLNEKSKVLDVGTGSGYEAAILSHLCQKVITIERIGKLADTARVRLSELGYKNVEVVKGDGSKGYEKEAPYDCIKVAATTENITEEWKKQLKVGGKIVYPQLINGVQKLVEATKTEDGFEKLTHGYVRFVPLITDKD